MDYFMFHKPRGCVTARRDERHRTVMDYLPEEYRDTHFPIGRLDRDTEGLLLITNDGTLTQRLLAPKYHVAKTYFFWAQGIPNAQKLSEVERGVSIYRNRDDVTAPAVIKLLEQTDMRGIRHLLDDKDERLATRHGDIPAVSGLITITEGKKHQVKRMIRYAGAKVVYLKRLSMGGLTLDGSLAPGEYRRLTEGELELLLERKE